MKKTLLLLTVIAIGAAHSFAAGKKVVVGFSQIGAESGWRTANTESIKSEAGAFERLAGIKVKRFLELHAGASMRIHPILRNDAGAQENNQ